MLVVSKDREGVLEASREKVEGEKLHLYETGSHCVSQNQYQPAIQTAHHTRSALVLPGEVHTLSERKK